MLAYIITFAIPVSNRLEASWIFLIIRPVCHSCSQRLSVGVTMQRGLAPEAVHCCFFHNTLCRQVTVFGRALMKYVLLESVCLTYCLGLRLTLHSNLALQRTHINGKENLSRLASALGPRKRAVIEGIARRKDRIPHKGFSHGDRSVWVWKVRPLQQQDERGSSRVFDVLL